MSGYGRIDGCSQSDTDSKFGGWLQLRSRKIFPYKTVVFPITNARSHRIVKNDILWFQITVNRTVFVHNLHFYAMSSSMPLRALFAFWSPIENPRPNRATNPPICHELDLDDQNWYGWSHETYNRPIPI
jgi:hypothetical protein